MTSLHGARFAWGGLDLRTIWRAPKLLVLHSVSYPGFQKCLSETVFRSFYNCGTFWGTLKMTISCKFNKLLFEKYSDWHSYSQGKIAGTGCWSLFLDKKMVFVSPLAKYCPLCYLQIMKCCRYFRKSFKNMSNTTYMSECNHNDTYACFYSFCIPRSWKLLLC